MIIMESIRDLMNIIAIQESVQSDNKAAVRKAISNLKSKFRKYPKLRGKIKYYDKSRYQDFINGESDEGYIAYFSVWDIFPDARERSYTKEFEDTITNPMVSIYNAVKSSIPGYEITMDGDWDDFLFGIERMN